MKNKQNYKKQTDYHSKQDDEMIKFLILTFLFIDYKYKHLKFTLVFPKALTVFLLTITFMGQKQPQPINEPVTFEQVDQSIKQIFDDEQTKYLPENIAIHIQRILQNLSHMIPAQKTQQGFVLNPKMIEIFYHKGFMFSMGKLINLLIDKLEEIMQRTLIMVKREEWRLCLDLANFLIFFTDDKLIRMIETVGIRSDLSANTAKIIQKLQRQGQQFTATQSLIDKLAFSEIERIEKCLRISLNIMISMRTQVITRSQQTLKVIEKLEQACFILYLKTLYSPQHSASILMKAKHAQFLKSNLMIGHYFLGKGSDLNIASIYEAAVLMLFNLIQKNKDLKEYKSLPTHLFKTLPIVSQNTVYDFVMNIALYSLTYIRQGTNLYSRFSCNRLMTLKLLDLLVKQVKISSPQITYYLQQICLQTRIGMIERSFVTDLVVNYVQLVRETVEISEKQQLLKKQKPSQASSSKIKPIQQTNTTTNNKTSLKYAREHHVSQILTKYLQAGKQNYNIKYSNKKYKITTVDIITQLQNDENIIQTQFRILCEKYIYEVVLQKKVTYQYNDRQIWSEILPNIIEDKWDGDSDDGGDGSGDDDERSGRHTGDKNQGISQVMVRQGHDNKLDNDSHYEAIHQYHSNEIKVNSLMQREQKQQPTPSQLTKANNPIQPQAVNTDQNKDNQQPQHHDYEAQTEDVFEDAVQHQQQHHPNNHNRHDHNINKQKQQQDLQ